MTDEPLVWHIALGLVAVNATAAAQCVWLLLFAGGWGFAVLGEHERALQGQGA